MPISYRKYIPIAAFAVCIFGIDFLFDILFDFIILNYAEYIRLNWAVTIRIILSFF